MSRDPFIGGGGDPQKNPYEKLLEQMKEEEKKKELFSEKTEKKGAIQAIMTTALKKVLDLFSITAAKSISSAERTFIGDDLENLKKAFKKLKDEDFSQNISFLKDLSYVWHNFIKNYHLLYSNKESVVVKKIEELIEKISTYPSDQENTMGFYLAKYAGEEWLPFPYMDILQKLYRDDKNILIEWISLIEEIISEIKKRKPIT